jgi:hypothetical protein
MELQTGIHIKNPSHKPSKNGGILKLAFFLDCEKIETSFSKNEGILSVS